MNQHDSEMIGGLLEDAGYILTEHLEAADVILFNTCCVREHAEQRLYGRVSQLKALKAKKPELIVGVGGCVAQKEKAALTKRFSHVDLVFGTNALGGIADLLRRVENGERPVVSTPDVCASPEHRPPITLGRARISAWVSVMRGCDNYCSYCVVPYVRGPQRSRRPDEVVAEVRALAEGGVVEVTLLGQNVNSYGRDLHVDASFARLLEQLDAVVGITRIRFTTSHPKDISTDLMRAIRDLPKVCEHVHLPVQAGSTRILELMNRGYSSEEYLRIVERLRDLIPHISLTTDIIVGFPGETEEDFEQTRLMLEKVRFDGAYIFKYSSRSGTAAGSLDNRVDKSTIAARHRALLEFQKEVSLERLKSLLNTTQSVLAESHDAKRHGFLVGRTRGHRVARFCGGQEDIGREIEIRVCRLDGWTLVGEAAQHSSGQEPQG